MRFFLSAFLLFGVAPFSYAVECPLGYDDMGDGEFGGTGTGTGFTPEAACNAAEANAQQGIQAQLADLCDEPGQHKDVTEIVVIPNREEQCDDNQQYNPPVWSTSFDWWGEYACCVLSAAYCAQNPTFPDCVAIE